MSEVARTIQKEAEAKNPQRVNQMARVLTQQRTVRRRPVRVKPEGWFLNGTVYHYIRDGRSLCGRVRPLGSGLNLFAQPPGPCCSVCMTAKTGRHHAPVEAPTAPADVPPAPPEPEVRPVRYTVMVLAPSAAGMTRSPAWHPVDDPRLPTEREDVMRTVRKEARRRFDPLHSLQARRILPDGQTEPVGYELAGLRPIPKRDRSTSPIESLSAPQASEAPSVSGVAAQIERLIAEAVKAAVAPKDAEIARLNQELATTVARLERIKNFIGGG